MIDIKRFRQKILNFAVRGQLVRQNSRDESAAILLEKIRREKEELIKDGQIKKKRDWPPLNKDESPFKIPASWIWVRLGEICIDICVGGERPVKFSPVKTQKYSTPVYSNSIKKDGLYGFTDQPAIFQPSITLSARGIVGFTCVRNEPFYPMVRLLSITPFHRYINIDYLDIVLNTLLVQGTGSSALLLTVSEIAPKLIPLPPLAEQRRIVKKAAEILSTLDRMEKAQSELNVLSDRAKMKILDLAFHGCLCPQDPRDEPAACLLNQIRREKEKQIQAGIIRRESPLPPIEEDEIPFEIPENWVWARLGDVITLIMGQSPDGETVSQDQSGMEFHQGKLYFSDCVLSESPLKTSKPMKTAPQNSILLSVRAPVGKVNITDRQICIGRGLAAVIPHCQMPLLFVYYYLISQEMSFRHQAAGTTFQSISLSTVKNQLIPLPPLSEQRRIVTKIEELIKMISVFDKDYSVE